MWLSLVVLLLAATVVDGNVRVFCFSRSHLVRLIWQLYFGLFVACVSANVTFFFLFSVSLTLVYVFNVSEIFFFFWGYLQMTCSVLYA